MDNLLAPEISVIVPVYKAEKYLHKCVDSLLAQTFTDFELLLIDDGSPDRSGVICDEYAALDCRVRVFHKANGGVSSARQTGLDNARGEYVIHADPDDWVESDMLEALYRKAKAENADMVICDFFMNTGTKQTYVDQKPSSFEPKRIIGDLFRYLHGGCWNKLIRRDLFLAYDIRFPEKMDLCEDLYVCISLLMNPIRISYLPEAFYHYVQDANPNTLSRGKTRRTVELLSTKQKHLRHLLNGTEWEGVFRQNMAFDAYTLLYHQLLDKKEYVEKYQDIAGIPANDFQSFCACLALHHFRAASFLVNCRRIAGYIYHKYIKG